MVVEGAPAEEVRDAELFDEAEVWTVGGEGEVGGVVGEVANCF